MGPSKATRPESRSTARSHSRSTADASCETKTIVAALLLEPGDATEALALERLVAHGEDLVEEQDVGIQERSDGEAETDGHSGRVGAYGPVDRVLELCESNDLVEPLPDVRAAEPVDRTVQEDVLAPREIGMEPGSELEERSDPPFRANAARLWA